MGVLLKIHDQEEKTDKVNEKYSLLTYLLTFYHTTILQKESRVSIFQ